MPIVQELTRFLFGLGFDAPLLHPRNVHRRFNAATAMDGSSSRIKTRVGF
jgi:hypothetical protein